MSKIVEINCETKEIIERDMNPDELAQHKKDIETNKKEIVEKEANAQAFNDAVAQAVAAILAAQTPATTAEPAVEEPTVTE